MSISLRHRATSGLLWSALERFGQQGCSFVVQLVLARLLAPEEFGLIAMVAVFVSIGTMLADAGFSRALIQCKEVSDTDLSTVFYFNLAGAVVFAFVLGVSAPSIAAFYQVEQLALILKVLGAALVLDSIGAVHRTLLTRDLLFKSLFLASLPATLVSGGIGIVMAATGYGVWALVFQSLSMKLFNSLFLWRQSGWLPSMVFSFASLRALFPYGSRLAVSGVIDSIFNNLYVLVIGKLFPPSQVGYFQRARAFQMLPVHNIQMVLGRVCFPLFSAMQGEPERMKRGVSIAIQLSCLLVFAGMALLAAISEDLILLLIGEPWLPCVPYLKWLCVAGAIYPLHAMNLNVLAALGRADLVLRLDIIKKLFLVANIILTVRYGIIYMVYGMVVVSFLGLWVNTHYTSKLIAYDVGQQVADVVPQILISGAVFVAAILGRAGMGGSLLGLFLSMLAGAMVMGLGLRFIRETLKYEFLQVLNHWPTLHRVAWFSFYWRRC